MFYYSVFFLMQGMTLGLSATSTPGPFQAFLLAQTSRLGIRRTLPLCFAPLASDGPIVVLVLVILTHLPSVFLRLLQVAGGLFMLYLARGMWIAFRKIKPAATMPTQSKTFFEAVLLNFISPWPYICWGTVTGPMFLEALSHSVGSGISFIVGFYSILIGGFLVFVVLAGKALTMQKNAGKILVGCCLVALVSFGCFQIWHGLFLTKKPATPGQTSPAIIQSTE